MNYQNIIWPLIFCLAGFTVQAQLTLHLTGNLGVRDTIRPGEPLLLEVKILNSHSVHAQVHNALIESNLTALEQDFQSGQIDEDFYNEERARLIAARDTVDQLTVDLNDVIRNLIIRLDDAELPISAYAPCWEIDPAAGKTLLDDDTRARLAFGIGETTTSSWSEAAHSLVVQYDSLSSNRIAIVLSKNVGLRSVKETQIKTAYFHLNCGDLETASRITSDLAKGNPDDLDIVTLQADVAYALEDFTTALDHYRRALNLFHLQNPDSYEAPEYLLDMIADLEQKDR